jgi:hypothetical protein
MEAAGHRHRASAVAAMYSGLIDGFVIDRVDAASEAQALGALAIPVLATDLLAPRGAPRRAMADEVVRFGTTLALRRCTA